MVGDNRKEGSNRLNRPSIFFYLVAWFPAAPIGRPIWNQALCLCFANSVILILSRDGV
jgi:hypothetical protein